MKSSLKKRVSKSDGCFFLKKNIEKIFKIHFFIELCGSILEKRHTLSGYTKHNIRKVKDNEYKQA
jgi:hypothetical protein